LECIYLKQTKPDLKFTKREHVIPAGLGGIEKLPRGYVSDAANEFFSPIELIALRKTFLAVNRENVGPGKRGTLNVKKVKSPSIRVLKDTDMNGDNFKLGFVFAGETYMIPQLQMDFNDAESSYKPTYFSTSLEVEDGKQILCDFRQKLIRFLRNRDRSYKLVHMPFQTDKHFINIGSYNGNWFAATSHKTINMDYLALFCLKDIVGENLEGTEPEWKGKLLQNYQYKLDWNINEFYFLYAKTAFNTLALFKGSEFVLSDLFDPIRNAILNPEQCKEFVIDYLKPAESMIDKMKKTPSKSHYVIITSLESNIVAYVGFYNERSPAIIKLAENYHGECFIDGLVCDWVNKKEYRLSEL
jgi:hypothetical protein